MSQWFQDMSINRKLSVAMLMASTAVLLVAGIAMLTTEFIAEKNDLREDTRILADLLGRNTSAPLAFHREEDVEEAARTLAAVEAEPNIKFAALYNDSGALFASHKRSGEDVEIPSRAPSDGSMFNFEYLEVVHPVVLDKKRIGTMYLRADLRGIYAQLGMNAAILGLVLLLAILVSLALSRRLRRPIAGPILELAEVARHVAQEKDFSARATRRGADEVGVLTNAFNLMLEEIARSQQSLEQANGSMQIEIRERQIVEERLRKTLDELAVAKNTAEAANRAKDQFLAVLSHELRTPLTPVLLTVSLLQNRGQLPASVQDDIQTIRRHVELEARLIDDLLDLTRITRGKLQLNFEIVDLHQVIRDAIDICCSDRKVDMKCDLAAPRHHVRADPARMLQVFWNMLSNAKKFSAPGTAIDVRTIEIAPNRIRAEVIDHGMGIDPAVLPRIFNAFEQADSSLTRAFGGLGLGLTIVRALVVGHGGTIVAHSEGRGKGAAFVIELPTVEPVPLHLESDDAPRAARHSPLRILLVEDHEGTLALMTKLLSGLGHHVLSASTVKGAIEMAAKEEIDLVISDLGLPDGTGHDVMRVLRSRYSVKGIALSGFGMDEDVRKSLEAGFARHLTKPIDLERLQAAIQQALR